MTSSSTASAGASAPAPEVAVAVATRDRPLRLRWLLNALQEQTFPADRFEVIVAHDSHRREVERLLESHSLRRTGQLRHFSFASGTLMAGAKRNVAWRASAAPLILFTDDDCRPAPDWIEQAVRAAARHPDAILQGRTAPDPDEQTILRGAPWAHTVVIEPPTTWGETCNIAYPRAVLEELRGFDEQRRVAEDSDLALRARERRVPMLAVPEMVVYHAVEERSLLAMARAQMRWSDMAWLVKHHPRARREMYARVWWLPEHAALVAAVGGAALTRRRRAAMIMALPWLGLSLRHRGLNVRGVARSITELPGRAAIDAAGVIALARGSVRYRTLLL